MRFEIRLSGGSPGEPNDPRTCDVLLKEATEHKKIGNWSAAIECLRRAYTEIEKGSTLYPVETFLRLPMYLHAAGRKAEAQQEFQKLISRTRQNKPSVQKYYDLQHVLDKIRLCMQRDKARPQAIKFGVLSYLYGALARYHQSREMRDDPYISKVFEEFTTDEAIAGMITSLLGRKETEPHADDLKVLVHRYLRAFPQDIDGNAIASQIDGVLGKIGGP